MKRTDRRYYAVGLSKTTPRSCGANAVADDPQAEQGTFNRERSSSVASAGMSSVASGIVETVLQVLHDRRADV